MKPTTTATTHSPRVTHGCLLLERASPSGLSLASMTSRLVLGERLERLEVALDSLADDHRQVIALRKFEELSFADIGARLGKSPDACRMMLARAMAALTLALVPEEDA